MQTKIRPILFIEAATILLNCENAFCCSALGSAAERRIKGTRFQNEERLFFRAIFDIEEHDTFELKSILYNFKMNHEELLQLRLMALAFAHTLAELEDPNF